MVAVGVDGERPVGRDPDTSAARRTPISGCSTWLAVEDLRQDAGEEPQLARLPQRDHVEQAVVELRVRGDVHAAAVGAAVGDRHPVAAQLAALAVEVEREGRVLPADQRAQRRVGVDELALDELRLVGDPVGVRVEAAAGDPEEAAAVDLADVDLAASRRPPSRPTASSTSSGTPSTRARSLPRPPQIRPMVAPVPASAPPTWPMSPSPLITTGISPASAAARASSQPCSRLGRQHRPVRQAGGAHRGLDPRQQLARPSAAGGRVEQQQEATRLAHRPMRLAA